MDNPSGAIGCSRGSGGDACAAELRRRLAGECNPARRLDIINETLRPPEPQLLDTCVLQNLDWVDRQLEPAGAAIWDDAATSRLVERYGTEMAEDLLDLGTLYKEFEHRSGYPWLVCNAAIEEAGLLNGEKGARLRQLIEFFISHQQDWSNDTYPGIAQGLLLGESLPGVSPLILRALGVTSVEQVHESDGPLNFLPDQGDRLVAAHALFSNIPVILTGNRRAKWAHPVN